MLEFGTDKPDLRNPLRIVDTTGLSSRDVHLSLSMARL